MVVLNHKRSTYIDIDVSFNEVVGTSCVIKFLSPKLSDHMKLTITLALQAVFSFCVVSYS